jgi:hypothetical protein
MQQPLKQPATNKLFNRLTHRNRFSLVLKSVFRFLQTVDTFLSTGRFKLLGLGIFSAVPLIIFPFDKGFITLNESGFRHFESDFVTICEFFDKFLLNIK